MVVVVIMLVMVVLIFRRGGNEGGVCVSIDTVPTSVSDCHRSRSIAVLSLQFLVMHVATFKAFRQVVCGEAGRGQFPFLIISVETEQLVRAVSVAARDLCRSSRRAAGRGTGGLSCHRCHCSSHNDDLFRKHLEQL